ncbi:hypothetical protein GCM10022226_03140 [Sphaerisporangium flaviroseum]|uniref:DUF2267 domain-containing protein n=1 Tax=Sphaerisporangium flaviroseum TaxID=509199 RepID=A0ABP7H820_9ACTN
MDQREFARTVAERANLSREEAADLTRATLSTLADRLSHGEARHLALYLPESLKESVVPHDKVHRFGAKDFVDRVSSQTGLNDREARQGIRAVMTTLREVVGDEVFTHVLSQLPAEFHSLAEATV